MSMWVKQAKQGRNNYGQTVWQNTGIAVHIHHHDHQVDWDEGPTHRLLYSCGLFFWKRRVQEALRIRSHSSTMNEPGLWVKTSAKPGTPPSITNFILSTTFPLVSSVQYFPLVIHLPYIKLGTSLISHFSLVLADEEFWTETFRSMNFLLCYCSSKWLSSIWRHTATSLYNTMSKGILSRILLPDIVPLWSFLTWSVKTR